MLKIANVQQDPLSLPFIIDSDRLKRIAVLIKSGENVPDEDVVFFDETANSVMDILRSGDKTREVAFLLIQMPFLHSKMMFEFIDTACNEEDDVACYYALKLNNAVDSDYRYDDLVSILLLKASVPLLIECVRTLPDLPIDLILKKVGAAPAEEKADWNNEVVSEAARLYADFCNDLSKKSSNTLHSEEAPLEEDGNAKVKDGKFVSIVGNKIKSIKDFRN